MIRLLPLDSVPVNGREHVFRYSPWRATLASLTGAAAIVALIWLGRSRSVGLAYYLAAVVLFFLVVLQTLVRARFRPSNWLVRAADDGLYIQFRSYLNFRFPREDDTVVFVPYRDIQTALIVRERRDLPDHDSPPAQIDRPIAHRRTLVELVMKRDVSALQEALAGERARSGPDARKHGITTTRYQHFPVTVVSADTVQVEWAVVPHPRILLEILGRHDVAVLPDVERTRDYLNLHSLSREEQEHRLLELAETGQTTTAIYLARRLYSFDLTAARAFVNGLRR